MISPLVLLDHLLPAEILSYIQTYLINDIATQAISKYFSRVFRRRELYNDFVIDNYIAPHCRCRRFSYRNDLTQLFVGRACEYCYVHESTYTYEPDPYVCCIADNPQYRKIHKYNRYITNQ